MRHGVCAALSAELLCAHRALKGQGSLESWIYDDPQWDVTYTTKKGQQVNSLIISKMFSMQRQQNHQQVLNYGFDTLHSSLLLSFSPSLRLCHIFWNKYVCLWKWKYQMTFSCLSLPLPRFSFLCFLLKIEPPPNHQWSAAAGPVGTGFGKRVPEMSLINSLRRREQGRRRERWWWGKENERDRGMGWLNNDREMERV